MQITRELANGMQEQRAALQAAITLLWSHRAMARTGYAKDAIEDNIGELAEEVKLLDGSLERWSVEPPSLEIVNG